MTSSAMKLYKPSDWLVSSM